MAALVVQVQIRASEPLAAMKFFAKARRTAASESAFLRDISSFFGGGVSYVEMFPTKDLACSFVCLLRYAKEALKKLASSFVLPTLLRKLGKCILRIPPPFHSITSGSTFTVKRPSDVLRVLHNVETEEMSLFPTPQVLALSYRPPSTQRQLPPELEKALTDLVSLEPGWAGEGSEPPPKELIDLFRTSLHDLPPQFEFPEIYSTSEGHLEFVWRDCRLYGLLDNERIELEWVGDAASHSESVEHNHRPATIISHINQQLQDAIEGEEPSDGEQ